MLERGARRTACGRVVNSSTGGAIYGDAEHDPDHRGTTPLPEAAYGQSKLAAEGYIGLFERLYALDAVTLRYGNVYGPRQDPLGEAGVIAIFCGKLTTAATPTVFGDGRQTRDYVYVGDVVAANLAAVAARPAGRSTSAPASRRACSSSSRCCASSRARGLRAAVRARPPRRARAQLPRHRARARRCSAGRRPSRARRPAP